MRVLIATPAYGGTVFAAYHESLLRTLAFFRDEFPGIQFDNKLISISMLPVARNVFASIVLNDPSYSHLLFIDADMGFGPGLIAKMLAFRKPVVGVIAPARKLDHETFHRARLVCDSSLTARLVANDYIAGDGAIIRKAAPDGSKEIEVVDGFVRVTHTGTGIMLIDRKVLEMMRDRYPDLWVSNPPQIIRNTGLTQGGLLQCFEPLHDQDRIALGEDLSFCKRWVEGCGGEIWSSVDEAILHIGQETFAGQYLAKMKYSPTVKLKIVNSSEGAAAQGNVPAGRPLERQLSRKERRAMRHART